MKRSLTPAEALFGNYWQEWLGRRDANRHHTDKDGRILPDAHFMKRGSTAKDLAYKVHTDLGDHFIRAIDARTHRIIGADYELKDGDEVRIVADA